MKLYDRNIKRSHYINTRFSKLDPISRQNFQSNSKKLSINFMSRAESFEKNPTLKQRNKYKQGDQKLKAFAFWLFV